MTATSHVVWHDVECSSYDADLALWRELAAAERGPILDVGAGTGRVALDLAGHGHKVVALDIDAELLAELQRRAAGRGLAVETVVADAGAFELPGRSFGLILAPMQTVQLLGPNERAGFLRAARAHLAPGGLVACALADVFEAFDTDHLLLPLPDRLVVAGVLYSSQPIAVRDEGDRVAIERIRETLDGEGRRTASANLIHLDRVEAVLVEAEASAAGLRPQPVRAIGATDDHVGSSVVMLREP
ncbi:MAG: class I SAM-dependent methyltransferase [Solirubrobacteraceae bacterium]